MDILEALRWRYATKKFDPQRLVPDDQVAKLLSAGNLTATSYGLQPFRFILLRNQLLQEKLIVASYGQRQVADASHVIVIATRTDIGPEYIGNFVDRLESERGLSSGEMGQYKSVMTGAVTGMSDEHLEHWAAKQAYLALGTLLTACATMEIDACPMEGFIPAEYNQVLGLTELNLHATIVLPIGYRAADDHTQHLKKVRQPISEMVVEIN